MRHLTPVALFCIAVMLLFLTFTGDHGVLQLQKINNELAAYQQKNRQLESDIRDVEQKIYAVQHDDFALEKVAREQLGLARPQETVYIFNKTPSAEQKTARSN